MVMTIAGAATTGPCLDPSGLQAGSDFFDIALPHSFSTKPPAGVTVWTGETMSMPNNWNRGFGGPIYHLVSGYGWSTCFGLSARALMVLAQSDGRPLAQGRVIQPEAVLRFGQMATELGFCVKPSIVR